jgi:serine/threonine-protein kinase
MLMKVLPNKFNNTEGNSPLPKSNSSNPLLMTKGSRLLLDINRVREVYLVEMIGRGGTATVWKVADCNTHKLYVLKIIQTTKPDKTTVERIRLESEVRIKSDYVIQVMGMRQWDSFTYLILFEYFEGKSLDYLLANNKLSTDQKRDIFEKVLLGIIAAHERNIIHRDLKPSNILIGSQGQVKIIDFGISKFQESNLTRRGIVIGTLRWIAPEILINGSDSADARADIYALGHILYELATGEHFWAKKGWRQLGDFLKFMQKDPAPVEGIDLSDFNFHLYPNCRELIAGMVKIDPNQRFSSANEILNCIGCSSGISTMISESISTNPVLTIISGAYTGYQIPVELDNHSRMIIGRNNIPGHNNSISRTHLELIYFDGQYFVRDLGSTNGTLLRGISLQGNTSMVKIENGDRIRIGNVFLKLTLI